MDLKVNPFLDFTIRFSILIISFLVPFIMLFTYGKLNSLSSYWNSPLQPIFIVSNALTTYIFINLPKWRLSALFLFLLTVFSVEYYGLLHNIFAVSFFLINIYPLLSIKRYRLFVIPYLAAFFWLSDLFWLEVHAITVLCVYHLVLMLKFYKLINR